ncbi:hypothetical protein CRP6_000043 [Riemerella phage vB_RanS_CRP6]|uniref:hypothetical protein n=1 Tax=Riemerella anatipestifer TaxID=34085 RepID=UPI000CA05F3A|nr:hypothetical protein [Riemerella anatipestifer]MCW0487077.1 hypothetical protein [Riemerella anatipestifer]WCS66369.1 hypothetical protein CRP5_000014 [Riemerella phage vB_RanS_CRP5]WIL01323.1 hypothetical protein CRP6_000043 [Riemerella phage vB_RanS_CRP6]WIT94466.1 hypothetical protein CRP19_000035 [Riemerella phage vB_RanS_CRP19]
MFKQETTAPTANNSSDVQRQIVRSVAIGIIKDAILFERIHDGLFMVINAFKSNGHSKNLAAAQHYSGIGNAIDLICDGECPCDDLYSKLTSVFLNIHQQEKSDNLLYISERVYNEWSEVIRDFYINRKSA